MMLFSSNRRPQETARVAVSCLFVSLALAACGRTTDVTETFVQPPQPGLSPQTMSGILITQEALRQKPDDPLVAFALAYRYLQAVRENADTDYYLRIEQLLEHVENIDAGNPEVPFLRGSIAAGRHDFVTAEKLARGLTVSHPQVARYHGLLADALIETGRYDEAVDVLQAMADINPDYAALTRIAYIREIQGDLDGAREAMEGALRNPTGVPENAAWAFTEYARLWLQTDPDKAQTMYMLSNASYNNYAPAIAGLAKVALAKKDYPKALENAQKAFAILPLPEYAALLGDVYTAMGETDKAASQYTLTKIGYAQIAAAGTDVRLERARFLAEHDMDLEEALALAREVYDERPTIYAADVLAWALFKNGEVEEAKEYMKKALATGTKDPVILGHEGVVGKAN